VTDTSDGSDNEKKRPNVRDSKRPDSGIPTTPNPVVPVVPVAVQAVAEVTTEAFTPIIGIWKILWELLRTGTEIRPWIIPPSLIHRRGASPCAPVSTARTFNP